MVTNLDIPQGAYSCSTNIINLPQSQALKNQDAIVLVDYNFEDSIAKGSGVQSYTHIFPQHIVDSFHKFIPGNHIFIIIKSFSQLRADRLKKYLSMANTSGYATTLQVIL